MIKTEEKLKKLIWWIPSYKIRNKIRSHYDNKFIYDNFSYQKPYVEKMKNRVSFKNKVVLDCGGGNIPLEYMKFLGVKKFICLDNISIYYKNKTYKTDKEIVSLEDSIEAFKNKDSFIIDAEISKIPDFFNEQFDIVISIDAFEHIHNLSESLNKIYNILKPGGQLLSHFAPIFSCVSGNHFFYNKQYNFDTLKEELGYIHLLYDYDEAKEILKNIFTQDKYGELANKFYELFLYQVYKSNIINRIMIDEHMKIYTNSNFNKISIEYPWIYDRTPDNILYKLEEKYGKMRYDAMGIFLQAIK
ncbi:methyltransferase domain-containing protein [Brachyspira pilosicoli]|uniref:Methyltransferase domain-containing protein n=1 Tax=Brachyspira pilosicoli TaxID=52584 RepID=A0A5C8EE29_BRAPL|nr:methyltransferase domain-containing protein [Brachyspira pilosicoli]TXJ35224.1 methyltransferase domain-containing protein [Brachyspira pilosicoli]